MSANRSLRCCAIALTAIASLAAAVFAGSLSAASATPYQVAAHAQCPTSADCILKFPAVPAGKRFDVQFAACEVGTASVSQTVGKIRIYLQTQQNGQTVSFVLARSLVGYQFTNTKYAFSAVSQPVGLRVAAGEVLKIFAWPSSSYGFADIFDCAVSGEMNDAAAPGPVQFTASAQCPTGKNCVVSFPPVPAHKRFETHYAACEATNAQPRYYLQTVQNGKTIATELSALDTDSQSDGTNYSTAVSQPVMFSVPAQQVLKIFAWPHGSSQTVDRMDCTVSGDMGDDSTPAPYQASAQAKCPTGVDCVVSFPKAAAPLHVQFAACEAMSNHGSPNGTRFYLQTVAGGGQSVALDLASSQSDIRYDSNFAQYLLESQPVEFDVPAGKALKIFAWPPENTFVDRLTCTVYGQLTP